MFTEAECRAAWQATAPNLSPQERQRRAKLWEDYFSHLAVTRPEEGTFSSDFIKKTVGIAKAAEILTPLDTVLDIGAGTGAFTLPFAVFAQEVTALDNSSHALSVARARLAAEGRQAIFCSESWDSFTSSDSFDLVFSSMCPAVDSPDDLLKMEQLSRRSCCVIAAGKNSYDQHRRDLRKLLAPFSSPSASGASTEAGWYFTTLYAMGRQPIVIPLCSRSHTEMTVEAACERYRIYFRIFGIDDAVSLPVLEKYFLAQSEHGIVTSRSVLHAMMIFWDVRGDGAER